MWWLQRGTSLSGHFGSADSLADLEHQGCVICDGRFAAITLHLDELSVVDSAGIDELARYCSNLIRSGSDIAIITQRAGLHRLLSRSGLAPLLRHPDTVELMTGSMPYTCPHRP